MSDHPFQTPLVEDAATPASTARFSLRPVLFILVVVGVFYAMGAELIGGRLIDLLHILMVSTLLLWWQWHDSIRRGIRLGSFLPVFVLLIQPLGVLAYTIKAGGWGWWRIFGIYLLIYIGYSAWLILLMMTIEWMRSSSA